MKAKDYSNAQKTMSLRDFWEDTKRLKNKKL